MNSLTFQGKKIMKRSPFAYAALMLSVSSITFASSIASMNKSEVMNAISDKTMTTISAATLNGKVIPDSFTGYFGKDGKMNGGFATKPEDASQNDKGTWMVKDNGEVCVKWEQWFDGKEQCVYFYKLKNALLIINTDKGFESLILDEDLKPGNLTVTTTS
jgi:hypothetical protein